MVDRNVENNEEILLAQIDPTGCPSGKILEYRDADERLQEHFFDCWQNPLEWRPKQGKRPSSYRVVRGTGYSIWAYDEALNLRWLRDAHETWYGILDLVSGQGGISSITRRKRRRSEVQLCSCRAPISCRWPACSWATSAIWPAR